MSRSDRDDPEISKARRDEWGRIYTTLCHGGHEDAAVYLEQLSDPEYPPDMMMPRGCYNTECDTACKICRERPAEICNECLPIAHPHKRDEAVKARREALEEAAEAVRGRWLLSDKPRDFDALEDAACAVLALAEEDQ